ncbi:hypothetical protein SHK09_02190 [Polaribacter sp. PL03]|uniref:hypothetical protein n=1 Tax=Polaribacter sp. PL03 TaxID=3088353 RepID=UPI0029CD751E|nr:hypothetical protein [Polaribacter sp. PL03]MDX6745588.1 hypothetical protein [Polaribacter sp. PL03]
MDLTNRQLQRVEHYLNVKDITYIDIRTEVFDHIVSDIEAKLEDKKLDFETVFYNVTDTWNKHLKQTSSFYFGIAYSLPKIVLDKAKKYFKKWFFLYFLAVLVFSFFVNKINVVFYEGIKYELNIFFKILTVLTFIASTLLFILKFREKQKSTYSFILKTQSWNFLIGAILLFDFDFFNKNGNIAVGQIVLLVSSIFSTYICFHFYKKHKEAIKKYKIS